MELVADLYQGTLLPKDDPVERAEARYFVGEFFALKSITEHHSCRISRRA